jgi:WS/DGAT/MGAT family acyltransferase
MTRTSRTSEVMTPVDHLMYRGELDPSTRSSMIAVYILDGTPAWSDVEAAFERTGRQFLRLRQRVVEVTGGLGGARWVTDPDFDLGFHLRRIGVPPPGSIRAMLDLVETDLMAPLDQSRPLWEAVLYQGLPDGGSALAIKASHAITDGIGGIRMNTLLFDEEREAPRRAMPPVPLAEDVTADELASALLRRLPLSAVSTVMGGALRSMRGAMEVARTPVRSVGRALGYVESARRVAGAALRPSPLLAGRSTSRRVLWMEVPLDDLKRASKTAAGSLNDAYLAVLCGALRRYHERMGVPVASVPLAVPINLRPPGDEVGGNHFTGTTFAAPVDETDVVACMGKIGATIRAARSEPALDVMGVAAPGLSRLPLGLVTRLTQRMTGPDVQASNIPGHRGGVFLAGSKVVKALGFGPLPGCALMTVLLSHGDTCFITAHYDPAAITEPGVFEAALHEAMDEVIDVGRPKDVPRTVEAVTA